MRIVSLDQSRRRGRAATALFLAAHTGDVALACGGTAARMASGGWRVLLVTVFGVDEPGWDEDLAFGRVVGLSDLIRLDSDAGSPGGTFAGDDPDDAWCDLALELACLRDLIWPDAAFIPDGDASPDHATVSRAAGSVLGLAPTIARYRPGPGESPGEIQDYGYVDIRNQLEVKARGLACYPGLAARLAGGDGGLEGAIRRLAEGEARRLGQPGLVEGFAATPRPAREPADPLSRRSMGRSPARTP